MWESPINIIHEDIKFEVENEVMKAVYKYGIDVDKDRLLEMLRGDSRSYDMGYATGKREVCEKILTRLGELHEYHEQEAEKELDDFCLEMFHHHSDEAYGIDCAIEIVKEEM